MFKAKVGRGHKKEMSAEQELKRKLHFKFLFRALGRKVMANVYWLKEDIDIYEGLDVKRRVRQAVRGKIKKQLLTITVSFNLDDFKHTAVVRRLCGPHKTSQREIYNFNYKSKLKETLIFSYLFPNGLIKTHSTSSNYLSNFFTGLVDKALLCKQAEDRTETEKRYLYRILGGLKCFKLYPMNVKRKLAALLYFRYYGPGRVVVRQKDEAHAMYFLVTGELIVSHLVWDDLLNQDVSVDISKILPGDMFGEVSLLHNIPRTATCTTNAHCELLILLKEDFKHVLLESVQKQWNEIQWAMDHFTYFQTFDEVSRREGCLVAKMKKFETNDIIFGDGNGLQNYVYFVISGQCQMIESLNIIETRYLGHIFYTLYDPYVPPEEKDLDLEEKYFARYKFEEMEEEAVEGDEPMDNKKRSTRFSQKLAALHKSTLSQKSTLTPHSTHSRASTLTKRNHSFQEFINPHEEHLSQLAFSKTSRIERTHRPKCKTYFMQVCKFNPGASFGFGENMRDRRIVALNPVYCMMLPQVWLLQNNIASIWTRIHHYLDKAIPKKAKLFKEFVQLREWELFRANLVEDVVSQSTAVNHTSIHDVPYSIRMDELIDLPCEVFI